MSALLREGCGQRTFFAQLLREWAPSLADDDAFQSTVKDLVAGSEITFEDRGVHELKGVGEWRLYAVSE